MIIAYRVPGVVAGIALILYTSLMLITLNAFDITLTLPGIAGIIPVSYTHLLGYSTMTF